MSPAISRTHLRSALLKPVLTVLITSAAMTLAGQAFAQDSTAASQSVLGDRFNVNFGLGMAVLPRYMGPMNTAARWCPC